MFEKILTIIGIGSAKVETLVYNMKTKHDQDFNGIVKVTGGKSEQNINGIYLKLFYEAYNPSDDTEFHDIEEELFKIEIKETFEIEEGEERVFPFSMKVPSHAPLTTKKQKIYLKTEVDIPYSTNPSDLDEIFIYDPEFDEFVHKLEELGFYMEENSGKTVLSIDKETQIFTFYSHYEEVSVDKIELECTAERIRLTIFKNNKKENVTVHKNIEKEDLKKLFY